MKIYTGYFAKARQYEAKGLIPVSIARYPPNGFSVFMSYPELAPTAGMMDMPENQFRKRYESILKYKNANQVVSDLKSKFGDSPIVLCCHEKPEEFCHRHIVAKWIQDGTGIKVSEYGKESEKPNPVIPECGSLF